MNILNLFDGISCGRLALDRAGIKYDRYLASEIDPYVLKISQKNYPDTEHLGDVKNIESSSLPKIDLLLAGSPCQGFSKMGKRQHFEDKRSKLFFEFLRLLQDLKPRYWFLENVVMSKDCQEIINSYLDTEPLKINSSLVSAQSRTRLYWTNIPAPEIKDKGILLDSIVNKDAEPILVHNLYGGFNETEPRIFQGKSPTLRTSAGGGHIPNVMLKGTDILKNKSFYYARMNSRKLTPEEAERLQTLPAGYTEGVSNTRRYHAIGNGWTVDLITEFFKQLKDTK